MRSTLAKRLAESGTILWPVGAGESQRRNRRWRDDANQSSISVSSSSTDSTVANLELSTTVVTSGITDCSSVEAGGVAGAESSSSLLLSALSSFSLRKLKNAWMPCFSFLVNLAAVMFSAVLCATRETTAGGASAYSKQDSLANSDTSYVMNMEYETYQKGVDQEPRVIPQSGVVGVRDERCEVKSCLLLFHGALGPRFVGTGHRWHRRCWWNCSGFRNWFRSGFGAVKRWNVFTTHLLDPRKMLGAQNNHRRAAYLEMKSSLILISGSLYT